MRELLSLLDSNAWNEEIKTARIKFMMLRTPLGEVSKDGLASLLQPFTSGGDLEAAFATALGNVHKLNGATILKPGEAPKLGVPYGIGVEKLHGRFVKNGNARSEVFGGFAHTYDGTTQSSRHGDYGTVVAGTAQQVKYATLGLSDFRLTIASDRLVNAKVGDFTDKTIHVISDESGPPHHTQSEAKFCRSTGMLLELDLYRQTKLVRTFRQTGEVCIDDRIVFPELKTTVRYDLNGKLKMLTVLWNREVECNIAITEKELRLGGR